MCTAFMLLIMLICLAFPKLLASEQAVDVEMDGKFSIANKDKSLFANFKDAVIEMFGYTNSVKKNDEIVNHIIDSDTEYDIDGGY